MAAPADGGSAVPARRRRLAAADRAQQIDEEAIRFLAELG
jgi:hypothetical protein